MLWYALQLPLSALHVALQQGAAATAFSCLCLQLRLHELQACGQGLLAEACELPRVWPADCCCPLLLPLACWRCLQDWLAAEQLQLELVSALLQDAPAGAHVHCGGLLNQRLRLWMVRLQLVHTAHLTSVCVASTIACIRLAEHENAASISYC